ncbi:hypothetical protein BDW74DRAFT_151452 [Aspergillus multicolor]|uniref:uncharacterized protein n=1 Tax=Aspergillus multicolor TaxID=41759 RepID=UPI003CCD8653
MNRPNFSFPLFETLVAKCSAISVPRSISLFCFLFIVEGQRQSGGELDSSQLDSSREKQRCSSGPTLADDLHE